MKEVQVEIVEQRLFDGVIADEIVSCIEESTQERGSCSLVLAGGSTPGAVYRALSRPPRVENIHWKDVQLFWGDERWVPKTDDQSNYRMVEQTLLGNLPAGTTPQVFPIDTSAGSPAAGATSYEETIRKVLKLSNSELPVFDIVILGLGEDGHTASLFPGSPLVHDGSGIAAAATNPHDKSLRVSLLPRALFNARSVFFIVKGEGKAEVVRSVLEGNPTIDEAPARLYTTATGKVTFFLDSAAGKNLSKKRYAAS